jgi:hypothetical protein
MANDDDSSDPFIRLFVIKGGRVTELGWAYPSESKAVSDDEQNQDEQGVPHHVTVNGEITHRFPAYDPNTPVYAYEDAYDDEWVENSDIGEPDDVSVEDFVREHRKP